jgi:hypothetical protein
MARSSSKMWGCPFGSQSPDDFLLDVGRFVVRFNPNELLQSSGQHPVREINPFDIDDPALLGGFCDLFD